MNIFAYHPDPYQAALWLDDVRRNKMILESVQMMSAAVHVLTPELKGHVYRLVHKNHPCSVWVRGSSANFDWLWRHTQALYEQRGKPHKSADLLPWLGDWLDEYKHKFMFDDLTPFANCARNRELGLDFTHIEDTHEAYRQYTSARWATDTIPLSWNYGEEPEWRHRATESLTESQL